MSKEKSPAERGFRSVPGEIRAPDLRFRSSLFAGLLQQIGPVEDVSFQLAHVRIAEFGTYLGTRFASDEAQTAPSPRRRHEERPTTEAKGNLTRTELSVAEGGAATGPNTAASFRRTA